MADIDRIADRPRAYLARTGVLPLSSGLVFFTLGTSALIQIRLVQNPEYRDYALVAQYAGLCAVGVVLWGIAVIKRRMVFPRGGYVELPRSKRRTAAALTSMAVLAILISLWPEARLYLDSRLVAPAFAVWFAVICFLAYGKKRNGEILAFGLYLLCLAPVLWWIPGNAYERMSVLSVAVGLPLAVAGAFRLRRYLKANPLAAEPPSE